MVADRFGCFVGEPILQVGPAGALVVAVKDNFAMAGLPTRAGLGGGRDIPAAADAAIVARLREAGISLLGKARMDEAAFGASGDNPHYGRTLNPSAPDHSPGGSSGGCAAAIAAGLCEAAIGTDTLGSVRIPAAYCGIVGFKPTRGLLPLHGVVPLSWTLDHVGLMGSRVDIVAQLLALFMAPPSSVTALRIGIAEVHGVEPQTLAACQAAVAKAGCAAEPCQILGWDPVATRRAGLLVLEAEGAVVHQALLESDDPALSPGVRRMLEFGANCGSGRLVRALQVLRQAAAALDETLRHYDVIALPTVPSPAFAWNDGPPPNQADFTAPANFGGHPAISLPVGVTHDGCPIGLQLIGRPCTDWTVIQAARLVEAAPTLLHQEPGRALGQNL